MKKSLDLLGDSSNLFFVSGGTNLEKQMGIIFVARKPSGRIVANFQGDFSTIHARAAKWIRENGIPEMEYQVGSLSEIRAMRVESPKAHKSP